MLLVEPQGKQLFPSLDKNNNKLRERRTIEMHNMKYSESALNRAGHQCF